jgi:PAS domain S-box-containing protein
MTASEANRLSEVMLEYGLKPCGIAVCFVVVALLWTFPLQHVIAYPFVFLFFAAIIGSAWFGGAIAGFIAVVLSSLLITYFFIPPLYSITVAKESQSFLLAFILSAIAIAIVSSARKRAEHAVRSARDQLEVQVQARTAELEQSNLEIRESERQLRTLTEAIPQQIWRADPSGRIEYRNQHLRDYIGISSEAIQGDFFFSILHPEDEPTFRNKWESALISREKFEVEARVRGADGMYRWFLVRGIPQHTEDGRISRWYGIHIDIEEQHRTQQDLLRAQDDLSRFGRTLSLAEMAASIAHELNTPLTALLTHASACRRWLEAEPANAQRAAAAAERIVQETTRAAEVVRRVRSLFSKTDYVRQSTDVNALVEEIARLLRDDAIRRSVSLKLSLAEQLPLLQADPLQIQQVLLNLATNGMDAMANKVGPKMLEISTGRRGPNEVLVSVSDCGTGFPEQVRARMFEPFFTTKDEGIGMGLAICRSIIEAHNGQIWSERSDEKTVFSFVLKARYDGREN